MSRVALFAVCILTGALAPPARADDLGTTSRRRALPDRGSRPRREWLRSEAPETRRDRPPGRGGRDDRPDPRGGAVGSGPARDRRQGRDARLGQLRASPDRRRRPGRLPGRLGLPQEHDRGPLGPGEGRPAAVLAGGIALDRAGHVHLSGPPAMVRGTHADGQRADLRRRRRGSPATARSTTTAGSTSAGPRGSSTSSPRPTDWWCRGATTSCRITIPQTTPVRPRYDVVYLRDDRGWYYRYSHMQTIDPAIKPGSTVKKGQRLGVLGKEGRRGGWSHQHFEIKSRQPSGKWGTQEGYAFLWQAALREFHPDVVAVARPHCFARVGDRVVLDGGKSWCRDGRARAIRLDVHRRLDGDRAAGRAVVRSSGNLQRDPQGDRFAQGHIAYDFAVVQIVDPARLAGPSPDDPRRVRSDTGRASGRPGDVQGPDVPHDRRRGDLGLRRRHARRSRSTRTATSTSTPLTAMP